jgi:hypothetical protein
MSYFISSVSMLERSGTTIGSSGSVFRMLAAVLAAVLEHELVETVEVDEESGCGSNIRDAEGEV